MAQLYLAHNAENAVVADRLAEIFRFLDFDVVLSSAQTAGGEDLPYRSFSDTDVLLVIWTPESRRDPWIVSQCRAMKDSGQMIVMMSKASASHALPLMIHDSCVVWLDDAGGKVSPMRLASLFSEIGLRSGRSSIGQCVFALSQRKADDRNRGLQEWVSTNPNDTLAGSIGLALQNDTTEKIHESFIDLIRQLTKPASSLSDMARGFAASLPQVGIPKRLAFAALGIVTVGILGLTLNSLVGDAPAESDKAEPRAEKVSDPAEDIKVANVGTSPPLEQPGDFDITAADTALGDDIYSDAYAEPLLEESYESASLSITDEANSATDFDDTFLLESGETLGDGLAFPEYDETVLDSSTFESGSAAPFEDLGALSDDADEVTDDLISDDIEPEEDEDTTDLDVIEDDEAADMLPVYSASEQGPGDAFADRLTDGSSAPEMVIVPAGVFQMGSPLSERGRDPGEGPQKTISISRPFAVGKFEVTVADYSKFVEATDYDPGGQCKTYRNDAWSLEAGRNFERPGYRQSTQHPVTCVNWPAAIAYVDWLSEQTGETYRLLSEAEWEYVARAGSEQAFPFGDDANSGCAFMNGSDESSAIGGGSSLAMACSDGAAYSARVGSYAPNNFGLHDLHGNVWEWTADAWNSSISGVFGNGAARETGESFDRVVRGGSWFTLNFWLRSASRHKFAPEDRMYDVGFRVARNL